MRWFLYIDIFILLTLKLIQHALITSPYIDFYNSLQYKFSFLKTTSSQLRNWNDETNDALGWFLLKKYFTKQYF